MDDKFIRRVFATAAGCWTVIFCVVAITLALLVRDEVITARLAWITGGIVAAAFGLGIVAAIVAEWRPRK